MSLLKRILNAISRKNSDNISDERIQRACDKAHREGWKLGTKDGYKKGFKEGKHVGWKEGLSTISNTIDEIITKK